MGREAAHFPIDWLEKAGAARASDLDLAVLLVNTVDLLEDPPDRLCDVSWLVSALQQVGHGDVAAGLTDDDLPRLRALRDVLRTAFEASDAATVAAALNGQLLASDAVFVLTPGDGSSLRFEVGPGRTGYDALAARLPAALAQHIAEHGVRRLGTCHSDPCRCAFVDRTRAATRRYCCSYCNDRWAARQYRRRNKR